MMLLVEEYHSMNSAVHPSTFQILTPLQFILSPIIELLVSNTLRFPNKIIVANEAAQMTFSFQPKRI